MPSSLPGLSFFFCSLFVDFVVSKFQFKTASMQGFDRASLQIEVCCFQPLLFSCKESQLAMSENNEV